MEVLRKYVRDESVDLCYIDPPFNSKRNYNQIYNNIGREDAAQAQAFMDTWTWYPIDSENKSVDSRAEQYLEQILSNRNNVQTKQSINLIDGFLRVLGRGSLMAYLVSMTVRIAEIHRVLKSTGSFYLHCDPTASHYLKLVCDAIFVTNGGDYRNEIIWKRSAAHGGAGNYNNIHDILLYFVKSNKATWNFPRVPHDEKYIKSHYSQKDSDGRPYQLISAHGAGQGPPRMFGDKEISPPIGRHWMSQGHIDQMIAENKVIFTKSGMPRYKRYLEETDGTPLGTVWDDIFPINSQAQERLGYPTQKPETLLERIIDSSSNPGDVILDAFCGCGTTVAAAQKLKRRWIGIDITYQSISLIMKRLRKIEGAAAMVELHGIPQDLQSVKALIHKKDDRVRKEFEKWAVLTFSDNQALINEKKGADKGIDGVAYTITGRDDKGNLKSMPVIFSVKSGHVERKIISELLGTVEREKAAAGILITMEKPTKPMIQEAKQAGQFKGEFATFDKLQIVTVQDILDQKRMKLPVYAEVLKQSQTDSGAKQTSLFDER